LRLLLRAVLRKVFAHSLAASGSRER